jgi:hypothetical protein
MVQKRQGESNRDRCRYLYGVDDQQDLEETTAAHGLAHSVGLIRIQASIAITAINAMASGNINQSTISRPKSRCAKLVFIAKHLCSQFFLYDGSGSPMSRKQPLGEIALNFAVNLTHYGYVAAFDHKADITSAGPQVQSGHYRTNRIAHFRCWSGTARSRHCCRPAWMLDGDAFSDATSTACARPQSVT